MAGRGPRERPRPVCRAVATQPRQASTEVTQVAPLMPQVLRAVEAASLLFAMFLALLLRVELIAERSLWIDEALSLNLVERGPAAILRTSASGEPHPPGYYLMLWLWSRAFGLSITEARLLSLLFGLACVLLTWLLGRTLAGRAVGLAGALLIALNPFQVFASNEIRMYMPLQFAGLLATLALWQAARGGSLGWWLLYGVLAACVGWVSYYGFLLLGAHALWLLPSLRTARARLGYALAIGAGLAAYSPWLPNLLSSVTSNPVPYRPPPSWRYVADVLATQAFGGHVWGAAGYLVWPPHGSPLRSALLASPFLVLAAWAAIRLEPKGGARLLSCCWAVPVAAVLAASVPLRRVAAYEYHLTYLQPYLALLAVAGLRELARVLPARRANTVLLAVAAGLLAILAAGVNEAQAGRAYQAYRFDLAARFLTSVRRQGEVAIYYNDVSYEVLRWYTSLHPPYIRIRPDPRNWSREASARQLDKALSSLTSEHRRIWLVLSLPVPDGSFIDLLSKLGERGYLQVISADFGGVRVVALARRKGGQ